MKTEYVTLEINVPKPKPACPRCDEVFVGLTSYGSHYIMKHSDYVISDPAFESCHGG